MKPFYEAENLSTDIWQDDDKDSDNKIKVKFQNSNILLNILK